MHLARRRRVSVGVEVVKDPAIIFLDEPTTGLDSEMALMVISSLKTMAKNGKMVRAVQGCGHAHTVDGFIAPGLKPACCCQSAPVNAPSAAA